MSCVNMYPDIKDIQMIHIYMFLINGESYVVGYFTLAFIQESMFMRLLMHAIWNSKVYKQDRHTRQIILIFLSL